MTNSSLMISQLPNAQNVASTDELVTLYNAISNSVIANGSPSVRTITVTNLLLSLANNIPGPFTNDITAAAGNVALKTFYYDTLGYLKLRIL